MGWDPKIFSYANLLDAADFGERDNVIRPLFYSFNTLDFETVSKNLTSAEKILQTNDPKNILIKDIISDRDILKNALIKAIADTHPELPSKITSSQYSAVRTFISQFDEIFSTNYDLLLYWARNKTDLPPEDYETDDGFRAQQCWLGYEKDPNINQNVHFLHGGLHIYDTPQNTKKHAYTPDGEGIIQQVRENLKHGNFPLLVSESTYQKKKQKIKHHLYLNFCFQALANLSGALFIYGHSIDENDKHIFDQIKRSHVSKIFVSIYGDENSEQNSRTKANAIAFLEDANRVVKFYQSESAQVWQEIEDV